MQETAFSSLGGERGKWVYVNILDIVKKSSGIVNVDGSLNAFTLVYRFYGSTAGTIYFDSLTLVSNGNPYEGITQSQDGEVVKDVFCKKFLPTNFVNVTGELTKDNTKYLVINEKSYILSFTMNYYSLSDGFSIYAYNKKSDAYSGIQIRITNTTISIDNHKRSAEGYKTSYSKTLNASRDYKVEVGFVNLYENENTVYAYVKIDGVLIGWELVEVYGMPVGNLTLVAEGKTKVTIS